MTSRIIRAFSRIARSLSNGSVRPVNIECGARLDGLLARIIDRFALGLKVSRCSRCPGMAHAPSAVRSRHDMLSFAPGHAGLQTGSIIFGIGGMTCKSNRLPSVIIFSLHPAFYHCPKLGTPADATHVSARGFTVQGRRRTAQRNGPMARRIDMHRRPIKRPASSYQKSERHPKNPGDRVRGHGAPFVVHLSMSDE